MERRAVNRGARPLSLTGQRCSDVVGLVAYAASGGAPSRAMRTASRAARQRDFTVRSEQPSRLAIVFWSAPRYQVRWKTSRSSGGNASIAA
jgi:hypothetical protein